jgi:hypothetical protein
MAELVPFVTPRLARRAGGVLQALVLGFHVLLARPLHPCEGGPEHAAAAPVGAHAHHQPAGHHGGEAAAAHDGRDRPVPADTDAPARTPCTCIDQCQATSAFAFPKAPWLILGLATVRSSGVSPATTAAPAARVPHLLPFPNGPPPALA